MKSNNVIFFYKILSVIVVLGISGCEQKFYQFNFCFWGDCEQNQGNVNKGNMNTDFNTTSNKTSSPEDFIRWHFDLYNSGNYDREWNNLSTRMQDKNGNYTKFINYWKTINSVRVTSISIIKQSDTSIECLVSLKFIKNNGVVSNTTVTYTLAWDSSLQQWIFA